MNRRGERLIAITTALLIGLHMILVVVLSRMDGVKEVWDKIPGGQKLMIGIALFILPMIYLCLLGRTALRQMEKEINRGNYYQVRLTILAECAAKAIENAQFGRIEKLLKKLEEEKGHYKNFCA